MDQAWSAVIDKPNRRGGWSIFQQVPTLILQSEASYHAGYDYCTVRFLRQAGVNVDFIKLEDVGILGNGHMMMLEKNNQEIAKVMTDWLQKSVK